MLDTIEAWFTGNERITRKRALKSDALYCDGKMFAFVSDGAAVLRLSDKTVANLLSQGKATRFRRGRSELKNWVRLGLEPGPDLKALAIEASSHLR